MIRWRNDFKKRINKTTDFVSWRFLQTYKNYALILTPKISIDPLTAKLILDF